MARRHLGGLSRLGRRLVELLLRLRDHIGLQARSHRVAGGGAPRRAALPSPGCAPLARGRTWPPPWPAQGEGQGQGQG
eukprot:scaffold55904_cov57-Phaeocystis_antarctica.AAC.1